VTTVQFFLVLAGFVGGGAILINVVLGAIVRLRALRNSERALDIDARLDRIEEAIEAVATRLDRSNAERQLDAIHAHQPVLPGGSSLGH